MGGRRKALPAVGFFLLAWAVVLGAWGLEDWRGFLAHPARAGLLAVSLLTTGAALAWRLDFQPFRKGQRPVGAQKWALGAIMLVGLSLVGFLPYADRRGLLLFTFPAADALRYLGLGLYLAGNAIGLAAMRSLGRQYSGYITLQEDHRLVQHGLYGLIRHPIYLRALMVLLGLPLLFRSWLAIPALAFGAVFVAARIRQEEKLLAENFGTEFDAYRRRTWRLLPYLY